METGGKAESRKRGGTGGRSPNRRLGWLTMMSCWVRWRASPVSVKEGLPAGDGNVAGQHLEGGGFPGAVDSQQPETLANTTEASVTQQHRRLQAVSTRLRCLLSHWRLTQAELYIWLDTNTTAGKPTAWANSAEKPLPRALPPQQTPVPLSEAMQQETAEAERRSHMTSAALGHQYLIPVIRLIPLCL